MNWTNLPVARMMKTIKSIVKLYIIYYDNMDFEGCNSSVHIDIIFCDICCDKFLIRLCPHKKLCWPVNQNKQIFSQIVKSKWTVE